MIICIRQNEGKFPPKWAEIFILSKLKTTIAGKFLRFLKELFSKSSLSRPPQRSKHPCALNRLRPAGCLEGVKSSLQGRFYSFTPRDLRSRNAKYRFITGTESSPSRCIPTQPSRKREGFVLDHFETKRKTVLVLSMTHPLSY